MEKVKEKMNRYEKDLNTHCPNDPSCTLENMDIDEANEAEANEVEAEAEDISPPLSPSLLQNSD